MIKLRPYQKKIVTQGVDLVTRYGFCYLAMEVRTGKTLTSLSICQRLKVVNALFITKKKAISSIESDMQKLGEPFKLTVINYESLHKVDLVNIDVIICDEAHGMGAFPKPSKRALQVKKLIEKNKPYVMLLSGTPTPESYCQMYHQVYGIPNNPYKKYKNFYRFCDDYVNVKERIINSLRIRDYSNGLLTILDEMKPYTISYSQKEAGFVVKTEEKILEVQMKPETYNLATRLKKDLVVQGKEEVILADTPVKLMQKLHQIYSGTIIFESGNSMVVDNSKAEFIKRKFKNKKIAIFYKFKKELDVLKETFLESITTDIGVFKDTNKNIALQIVSGREGISLRHAEALVYFNIDFSATSYWQSRDRMTTKNRMYNKIYWVFSNKGIEKKIYKAVVKKKDYTLKHFKRDLLSL
jgi:hypothetical protein|tara:strand:+ start:2705 stop:3937 length:1233 start_codon:yes stop_codon:yes gene_type:complete